MSKKEQAQEKKERAIKQQDFTGVSDATISEALEEGADFEQVDPQAQAINNLKVRKAKKGVGFLKKIFGKKEELTQKEVDAETKAVKYVRGERGRVEREGNEAKNALARSEQELSEKAKKLIEQEKILQEKQEQLDVITAKEVMAFLRGNEPGEGEKAAALKAHTEPLTGDMVNHFRRLIDRPGIEWPGEGRRDTYERAYAAYRKNVILGIPEERRPDYAMVKISNRRFLWNYVFEKYGAERFAGIMSCIAVVVVLGQMVRDPHLYRLLTPQEKEEKARLDVYYKDILESLKSDAEKGWVRKLA